LFIPEHLRLTAETGAQYTVPSSQYSAVIRAAIEAVERLGAESHVYLKTGNRTFVAPTESRIRLTVGERVLAAMLPEDLYFLDAMREAAIPT
jgi:ABC-type sugar transport system ATPase subunit